MNNLLVYYDLRFINLGRNHYNPAGTGSIRPVSRMERVQHKPVQGKVLNFRYTMEQKLKKGVNNNVE